MSHNQSTHQTGRNTPWSCPYIFHLIFLIYKLNIKCLGKVLSEEMRCTALQCFSILHHSFDGISIKCTGKTFVSGFYTFHYRNSHVFLSKFAVYIQHSDRFFLCLFACSMSGMSFLPQEFGSTQEKTGTHFPTENVCPLITKNRQVTIRLNPVFICIPDDCFWCRANNQFLFQFGSRVYYYARAVFCIFQTVMSHYGTFFSETFYVFCFAAQEWFWN